MQRYFMSMNLTKEKRNELEKILADFLKDNNIKLTVPVDVFALATELGFDVRGAEFEDTLDGVVVVDEHMETISRFTSNKVILYNCRKSILDKKFSVAHELAHYIFEKKNQGEEKLIFALRDHKTGYSEDELEQEMDYIAAAILIPCADLAGFYKKSSDLKKVAERYKVDPNLAQRRVSEVFG